LPALAFERGMDLALIDEPGQGSIGIDSASRLEQAKHAKHAKGRGRERKGHGKRDKGRAVDMSVATTVHESTLLLTLEETSQLISHSHNPHETRGNIVRLIQRRFCTDVSSVYLLSPESGELVPAATVELDQSGVGRVRMRLDEGLTGLVAERMSPIMEPDASAHPRFKYFPEARGSLSLFSGSSADRVWGCARRARGPDRGAASVLTE
jgi:hypothetical protein